MNRDADSVSLGRISVFRAIRTRRSFEEVIEQITEAIRSGDLRMGDKLPSERVLAARMNISRPTLREAVKILGDIGVLEVRLGSTGGMFVASEVVPRILLEQRSRLRLSEVAEMLEARRLIEPCIAEVASRHATEGDFASMSEIIALHQSSLGDRARIGQFDLRFHLAMARATKNSYLISMMRLLQRDLEVVRDMAMKDPFDHQWTITIHQATVAAIRSRDPHLIGEVMDEHLSYLERVWQEETGHRLRSLPAHRVFVRLEGRKLAHP